MGRTASAALIALALIAQDLSRQGAEAMRAGRFADAERIYRELVKQAPEEAGWHANLGLALHSQGRYREAIPPLERSLKMRPVAALYAVVGLDYLKAGEPCKAIDPLKRSDQPKVLADAYFGCKRYAEAAALYEKTNQWRAAAGAYWHARDYDNAKRLFAPIAKEHATEAEFAYEFGDTLLRSEGAAAALPFLERATSLVEGRAALGKAYVELGRYSDAIPHLEAGAAADPDLYLPLSRAYKATGRDRDAERALSQYKSRPRQN